MNRKRTGLDQPKSRRGVGHKIDQSMVEVSFVLLPYKFVTESLSTSQPFLRGIEFDFGS
jgi:crotonobetainyl-CoA:carnitine CoA-transferase CaiB-like acyl-CoA transferase